MGYWSADGGDNGGNVLTCEEMEKIMDNKLRGIRTKLDSHETRISAFEQKVEGNFGGINKRLGAHERILSRLVLIVKPV